MNKMKRQHIKLKNTPQVKKYNQALKRASTDKMKVIAKKYGVDFGEDNEMELGEYLKKKGYKSLAEMLKTKQ